MSQEAFGGPKIRLQMFHSMIIATTCVIRNLRVIVAQFHAIYYDLKRILIHVSTVILQNFTALY